jgi:alkylation response protein AidB-like acyl-CoA dehydrogenase
MDFTFTEAQLAARREVRRVLMTEVSPERLRELWDTEGGLATGLWPLLARLGLTALSVPAAHGGRGGTDLDWALIAQEAGYYALPAALLDTAWTGVALLAALPDSALAGQWLPSIARGQARLALGHPVHPLVADAEGADLLLLHHQGELHALAGHQARLTRAASVDPTRRLYRVDWQPGAATRIADAGAAGPLWQRALDRGALSVAAQCSGLAMRMLDLAIDHSAQRKQFGRPIGAFQAVKHQLADVAVRIEFSKPVMFHAACAVQHADPQASLHVSHARLALADAARLAARHGLQVHGAPGYAWDGDLQIFMKRAWALEGAWGTRQFHKSRVAAAVLREGAAIGARHTFAEPASPGGAAARTGPRAHALSRQP